MSYTFWARAENLSTLSVSSKQEELWLILTTMQTRPEPQKKNCKKWVSLDSLKGMWCWNLWRPQKYFRPAELISYCHCKLTGVKSSHCLSCLIHGKTFMQKHWKPNCLTGLWLASQIVQFLDESFYILRTTQNVPTRTYTKFAYFDCWFSRIALMHFPRVRRELLMFPASFSLSPVFWVREQRSDPARSHRASLAIHRNESNCEFVLVWDKTYDLINLLANAQDSGNADVLYFDDTDGKDAVATESQTCWWVSVWGLNKHKKAAAAKYCLPNERSWTVCWGWSRRTQTHCSPPPAGQLV